jgi:hypothetical protein
VKNKTERFTLVFWLLLICQARGADDAKISRPEIPRVWNDAALADWATPVAGLNVRPRSISAQAYYSLEIENLRTYPVYFPGREPEGYWEILQHVGPQPLIEPRELKAQERANLIAFLRTL